MNSEGAVELYRIFYSQETRPSQESVYPQYGDKQRELVRVIKNAIVVILGGQSFLQAQHEF